MRFWKISKSSEKEPQKLTDGQFENQTEPFIPQLSPPPQQPTDTKEDKQQNSESETQPQEEKHDGQQPKQETQKESSSKTSDSEKSEESPEEKTTQGQQMEDGESEDGQEQSQNSQQSEEGFSESYDDFQEEFDESAVPKDGKENFEDEGGDSSQEQRGEEENIEISQSSSSAQSSEGGQKNDNNSAEQSNQKSEENIESKQENRKSQQQDGGEDENASEEDLTEKNPNDSQKGVDGDGQKESGESKKSNSESAEQEDFDLDADIDEELDEEFGETSKEDDEKTLDFDSEDGEKETSAEDKSGDKKETEEKNQEEDKQNFTDNQREENEETSEEEETEKSEEVQEEKQEEISGLSALKNLADFTERERGGGFELNFDEDVDVSPLVIKTLIAKFLNQRFCRRESDLNKRAYSFEKADGMHTWDTKAVATHLKTQQLTKVLKDKYGYSYDKGKSEEIPLSFYFDLSGSMNAYSAELATIALELIKRDVKVLVGYNETVRYQIESVSPRLTVEELGKKLIWAANREVEFKKNEISAKKINRNIDTFLIDSKAEKCVVFSDFDIRNEVIRLSQKCKTYWFCFEKNASKSNVSEFKGFIYKTQNIDDVKKGLIKVNSNRFENLCFMEKEASK